MTRQFMMFVLAVLAASAAQAAPIAGLWEGTYHGPRGDQALALIARPRGEAGLAGTFYLAGAELGPLERGAVRGDSLWFHVADYDLSGQVSGDALALSLIVPHGAAHALTLARTSADTTAVPASVREAQNAPPKASTRDVVPDSVYAAHGRPADEPTSSARCLRRGRLLLVGGGPSQPDIEARFFQLAGGDAAKIVVIPTAHLETEDPGALAGYALEMVEHYGGGHVTILHTISRKTADSEAFVKSLREATAVWIDGGEGTFLLDAYMGTRTERELIALLDRGGVIGGTSAGALIWGSRSMVFRQPAGAVQRARSEDLLVGQPHEPCLGVLRNTLVAPHFTAFDLAPAMEKMVAAYPQLTGLGIDEATALEVHADTCRVMGREHVTVYRGGAKPVLTATEGTRFNLKTLGRL
jgi:cyanophycinase